MTRSLLFIAALMCLVGCADPTPPRKAIAAPALNTKPLGDHLSAAEARNLSAAEKNKRLQQLLKEQDELIRMFP